MLKFLYLLCGLFSLILWFIGVVLPIIPGWPFLIPALYCLYKVHPNLTKRILSSPKVRKFIPQGVLEKLEKKFKESR